MRASVRRKPLPAGTQLFVKHAVLSRSWQRRTASTMAGRTSPASNAITSRAVDLAARRPRLVLVEPAELVERHVAALELRPRVAVGVGRVERPQEAVRQAALAFVAGERLKRAREDHATEVEECGRDHGADSSCARGGDGATYDPRRLTAISWSPHLDGAPILRRQTRAYRVVVGRAPSRNDATSAMPPGIA